MSLLKAYQNLSPKAKLGVGIGLVTWGLVGMWASDRAEAKLGLTPSEHDKAELDKLKPKIHIVDRDSRS